MATASNKTTTTEGKKTTDKTRLVFDIQKARQSLLENKSGICPFCGHKM